MYLKYIGENKLFYCTITLCICDNFVTTIIIRDVTKFIIFMQKYSEKSENDIKNL